uniref:translation initiation factor IF-3 n=1 Tax=Anaerococcus mediterraneensis TaxID=1870984 RepID=UPI00156AA199|nr:translation initiation factor IF-3 [Anaerococcus mediterraneensis]
MKLLERVLCARYFYTLIGGITIKDLRINDEIRASQVRLIDENGNQIGITSLKDAQDMADEKRLDLVLMSPKAKPPVTRIMDYGKFKYDQEKKDKENRKKQKNAQLKETRFSLNIEDNDLQTKANQTKKFLNNGDKVKVSIRFRGRELGRKEPGYDLMEKFNGMLDGYGKIDKKPKMEGRSLVMFLEPNNEKGE